MRQGFGAARGVIAFVEFIGWCVIVIGLGAALVLASLMPGAQAIYAVGLGAGVAIVGLVLVVLAQLARAMIATAENTGALVDLMRAQGAGGREGRAPGAALPVDRAGGSSGAGDAGAVIKRYKGQAILRAEGGAVRVGDAEFANVIAAERWIDCSGGPRVAPG